MDECGFDILGYDELGADPVVLIPTAGANYTDPKTIASVQAALVARGYSVGKAGVDGVLGSDTKAAIKKMQKDAGLLVTGTINEDVIMALKVTPGVLQPGVSIQGKAALQAQVALDAATKAEHAKTPGEVQQAAQEAVDATVNAQPPIAPEIVQAARDALERSKRASTPAQVEQAKQEVKQAAQAVAVQVAPSWWVQPAWAGGWERWKVVATATGGAVGLFGLLVLILSGGRVAPAKGPR